MVGADAGLSERCPAPRDDDILFTDIPLWCHLHGAIPCGSEMRIIAMIVPRRHLSLGS